MTLCRFLQAAEAGDGTVLTSDLQEAIAELCEKGSPGPTIADIIS
jgi:hypothetical protein